MQGILRGLFAARIWRDGRIRWLAAVLAVLAMLAAGPARALTAEQALAMAAGDSEGRIAAMQAAINPPGAGQAPAPDLERVKAYLQALQDDEVQYTESRAFVVKDGQASDPVTGEAVPLPADAQEVMNNTYMRGQIEAALAVLQLQSPDEAARLASARALLAAADAGHLPLVERALASEKSAAVRSVLDRVKAVAMLGSDDAAQRLQAVKALAEAGTPETKVLLNERLGDEADADVKAEITQAIAAIDERLAWGERLGALFSGLSLGSVLLLAALGLAITYGLMGVINMAHGELIMIGAYATYLVQVAFRQWLPEAAFGWYLLAAVPASFLAAALVGAVMERGVIRFLYGRPLETLLATFGISLILQQGVRTLFGAQNVGVENPAWMSGSVSVLANLSLPWNRIVIVAFAAGVLGAVAFMLAKTRLGLFVRGVTQNRAMASCTGVNTARIDTQAFALGSGIAGLAGCALSQIGNVGPDLGQNYIVDSFLVVVLGGVGQLAGTVYAALGLGLVNKLLEGWTGAVLAKIAVLLIVVIFIQKRPQGIFALKGRSAEA
jgi:urea transport system permease protein